MKWPSRSPDLNIIENCWGQLARAVYFENRQYETVEDLKMSIIAEWEKLPQNYIKQLFKSLPKRLANVLNNNGGPTKY